MASHAGPVSMAIACAVGVVQHFFLVFATAWIAACNPLPGWLARHAGSVVAMQAWLLPVDGLIHVSLSLPAAWVLTRLRPARLWLYLLLAVVPALVWANRWLPGNPHLVGLGWRLVPGLLVQLFALPLAAWFWLVLDARGRPGNRARRAPAAQA